MVHSQLKIISLQVGGFVLYGISEGVRTELEFCQSKKDAEAELLAYAHRYDLKVNQFLTDAYPELMYRQKHPTHRTRTSDASTFDEVCTICGHTDQVPGGWGRLAEPCPGPT